MKVLQINTVAQSGSTGRITSDISDILEAHGHQSVIAYGRGMTPKKTSIKIGTAFDKYAHGVKSLLFDRHGFGSYRATKEFTKAITALDPDVIHLHNLHGYYLNVEVLFKFLKEFNNPIVWTLHDCWPFTGHCAYYDYVNCYRWETECFSCPNKKRYPLSILIDNSTSNFHRKKALFNSVSNLTIVTPSHWLARSTKRSFLGSYPVEVIHNGIDLQVFKPQEENVQPLDNDSRDTRKIILGVASVWNRRKGFDDFIQLSRGLPDDYRIVLVGLDDSQRKGLPANVTGIAKTGSVEELRVLYSTASVFVNPTSADNFPTTNLEALACGTPVVTYETGGSAEAIDSTCGLVVQKNNVQELKQAILELLKKDKSEFKNACLSRAVSKFSKDDRYHDYLQLYLRIHSKS
jgi:putative colanic acid biosynthesis glycosyltransferase